MVQARTLDVLITVKTYPIPSKKYDELVCTAGVLPDGQFVRLYPINFRDLPFSRQYRKYQWIRVRAEKHGGRDSRKESYRPYCDTLKVLGEPIPTGPGGDWSERAKFALAGKSDSMEHLYEKKNNDGTSLGVFRPKNVKDLIVSPDTSDWKPSFRAALLQAQLWETRRITCEPPRKVPFRFQYVFECDDGRCKGKHQMMIEDWELGALFWKLVDKGDSHERAAEKVKERFLTDLCGPDKETYFYVGTVLGHGTWVVIGVFYPSARFHDKLTTRTPPLFR